MKLKKNFLLKNLRERKLERERVRNTAKIMKGGKKRPSVDPPLPPPPPPPPAGDGGEKCGEGDHPSSVTANPPFVDGPAVEDRSQQQQQQQQQQQRKRKTTTVEKEKEADEGDGEEEEADEEEGEEEEGEKGDEHSEELQMEEGEEEGEGDEERPKLAEGFYEIEAVRRKRIRKGQAQYLIKWRGWPETANTWEPLENLLSCSDVIDAFEESSRSGKRPSRKRRRRYGTTQSQTKKKQQQRSPAAATYNVPAVKVRIMEKPLPFPPLNDVTVTNGEASVSGANNVEPANIVNENGLKSVTYRAEETEEHNELYLKISQLKGATAPNGDFVDKIPLHSKEAQLSEQSGLVNGLPKADSTEVVQSARCIGAKRRKSGSVKRFKLEMPSGTTDSLQNGAAHNGSCGVITNQGVQNTDSSTTDLQLKNKIENSKTLCDITEIIRPVGYSTLMMNNIKDVSVTFMAKRADGKEVTVDNKFLKANYPVLLINFYEQHLRWSTMLQVNERSIQYGE